MGDQHEPKVDVESPLPLKTGGSTSEGEVGSGIGTGEVHIDPKRERALIWKIDMHILPFVVLLYLFSFLDRGVYAFSFPLPLSR